MKATINNEIRFDKWKCGELLPSDVHLTVGYDMGWNKRSSGHKYDSSSGHGFLVGGRNKKIIGFKVLSKHCNECNALERKNLPNTPHECSKNHVGTSKSMETEAIFRLVTEAYFDRCFCVGVIISDDDSTMKANLKHSWQEKVEAGLMSRADWPRTAKGSKKKDNGRLPLDIPEPSFLADFNHRVKSLGKLIYSLAAASKSTSEVDKAFAARLKAYWGAMLKQIRHLSWEENQQEIINKMLAPLEHLFDNHQYCGDWCYAKKAKEENLLYIADESRPFYNIKTQKKCTIR